MTLDGALTAVPYRLQESGRIIVDVAINDQGPFPFALDTAASISSIFDPARTELGLESDPESATTVHGITASGSFPLLKIDRLRLGDEVWLDAEIVSLPGDTEATSNIAGILGIDFLQRYGVGFSARDQIVRFFPPNMVRNNSFLGWSDVRLYPIGIDEGSRPLYFFEVSVGDKVLPALFDLGAGLNIINPPGAAFLDLQLIEVPADSILSGAVDSAPLLALLQSEEVTTADIAWLDEVFVIADLQIFSTLLSSESPLAILGSGLFNQRDFVIDFIRNRLLVRSSMDEIEIDMQELPELPD